MIFYPPLKRRDQYEVDAEDGGFLVYKHYRSAIAEDCKHRCVYCDIHQNSFGGLEAMEMDHFRPWNKKFGDTEEKKFEHLVNHPENLVHSCGICNGFKWAHWPTEDPDVAYDHEKGWIDPFKEIRSDFLHVQDDGAITDLKSPAKYQIKKLRLNRPFLKRLRELRIVLSILETKQKPKWVALINDRPGTPSAEMANFAIQLLDLFMSHLNESPPT